MRFEWRVLLLGVLLLAGLGCPKSSSNGKKTDSDPTTRPRVFVTNYPLKYFAQRIGGEFCDVVFPMTDDGDPAYWQPDADVVQRYQNADAILINGATGEKWIDNATLPAAKIVDTSAGFADKFIRIENAETHSHGPEGEHSHAGTVFTTWIDFDQAAQQATAIHGALLKLIPAHGDGLNRNLNALLDDLKKLDQEMTDVAKRIGDRPLIVSHPIYHYFARRYSLNVQSVLWEPDVIPSDEALADLKKILATHPGTVMLWEGTPEPESVDKLKAIGLASVVFDPCANVPSDGDWLSTMRHNIQSLEQSTQAQ